MLPITKTIKASFNIRKMSLNMPPLKKPFELRTPDFRFWDELVFREVFIR